MEVPENIPPELAPFPPYQGLDNGYDGAGMYADPGEVVSVSESSDGGGATSDPLPFEISSGGAAIQVAAGTIDAFDVAASTTSSPADGLWRIYGRITIVSETGVITGADLIVSQSEQENTTTLFHALIGDITVTDGVADASTINQYNYGPILVIMSGAIENVWQATMI